MEEQVSNRLPKPKLKSIWPEPGKSEEPGQEPATLKRHDGRPHILYIQLLYRSESYTGVSAACGTLVRVRVRA
jgi:hypothetical protein